MNSDPLDYPTFVERVQGIRNTLYRYRNSPPEAQLVRIRKRFRDLGHEMGWPRELLRGEDAVFEHNLLPRPIPVIILEDLGQAYRVLVWDTMAERLIPKKFIKG